MARTEQDIVATAVRVSNQVVYLNLADGSTHSFPLLYYPRLAQARPEQQNEVVLRVGGRALRWDELDEDIWIADAVCQNYPKSQAIAVAEMQTNYNQRAT